VSETILLSGKHHAEEPRAPGKWFLTPFPPFPLGFFVPVFPREIRGRLIPHSIPQIPRPPDLEC
jgi:hypothetical protein